MTCTCKLLVLSNLQRDLIIVSAEMLRCRLQKAYRECQGWSVGDALQNLAIIDIVLADEDFVHSRAEICRTQVISGSKALRVLLKEPVMLKIGL